MIQPDLSPSSKEAEAITEEVFKPGNLVWGTLIDQEKWVSLLQNGILSSALSQNSPWGARRRDICMGIIPHLKTARSRLVGAMSGTRDGIGIVIDTNTLKKLSPNKLTAVGDGFLDIIDDGEAYEFDEKTHTIFGIPLKHLQFTEVWPSEVRFSGLEEQPAKIQRDFWKAIVVNDPQIIPQLQKWTAEAGGTLNLPIFSYGAEFQRLGL